ncbi:MAG: triose-phosphate isomerase [Rhodocyclaceae bacterium]|nr:triose-phosphate isomerase [Rhodocyclaceae bacterium]
MARKLIAANWKMNGSLGNNAALAQRIVDGAASLACEVLLCVPYPYLGQVGGLLAGSRVALGAQDLSEHDAGAYTGEVSAAMLKDVGCSHVVVGHSERRKYHGESDALVLAKVHRAQAAALVPIVCVGESREQREAGDTERVVLGQIEAVFGGLDDAAARRLVLAYEPVWAIGTGLAATPEMAQAVHASIRGALVARLGDEAGAVAILYGGSVNADNAAALFAMPDIDGALVGGASLDAEAFISICVAGSGR